MKNKLSISRGDFKDIVNKYRNLLTRQYNKIIANFSVESQKFIRRFKINIFSLIIRKISIYTLDLIFKQYSKLKLPQGQETIDIKTYLTFFRLSYGLLYAHKIQRRLDTKKLLQLKNFHPH